jgi:hypothetical protein
VPRTRGPAEMFGFLRRRAPALHAPLQGLIPPSCEITGRPETASLPALNFSRRRRVLLLFVWSSVGTCNYSVPAIRVFFWAVQSRTDGRTHRHTGKFRSFIVGEYILFYLSGVLEFKIIQKLAKFCVIWQEKLHIYLRHTHLLGSTYYCGKKVNRIQIRNLGEN